MTTATDCCRSRLFHLRLSRCLSTTASCMFSTFNHLTSPIPSGGTRSVFDLQRLDHFCQERFYPLTWAGASTNLPCVAVSSALLRPLNQMGITMSNN